MSREDEIFEKGILRNLNDEDFATLRRIFGNRAGGQKYYAFFNDERSAETDHFWDDRATRDAFRKAGLIKNIDGDWSPTYRIHRVNVADHFEIPITTDFPDERCMDRVFPWKDEAEYLLAHIESSIADDSVRTVLNLCSGTGAIALGMAKLWPSASIIGVDNSERAVMTAEFNCRLNGVGNARFLYGDLFAFEGAGRYDLIVADPPYSLHPMYGGIPAAYSAGGKFGDKVIREIIPQVAGHLNPGGRFVTLAYSLGDHGGATRLEDLVKQHFGKPGPDAAASLTPVDPTRMKVWRYQDHKCMRNPMPLEYMIIRCFDTGVHHSLPERNVYEDLDIWTRWIEQDLKGGRNPERAAYTHLHYMVLDYYAGGARRGCESLRSRCGE